MLVKPRNLMKAVTTAGTQEQLTTAELKVSAITIVAERSNTGYIYIGDKLVSSTSYGADLSAGDSVTLSAADLGWAGALISVKDIWIDASVSTDGVSAMYFEGV